MKNRDRLEQPKIATYELGTIQEPIKVVLDNEVPLFLFNAGKEDIIQIDFTFDAGEIKSIKPLVATTTNMMLEEGTISMTAQQLRERLDFYGIIYSLFCTFDKAGISLFCLNKYLENALILAAEMLISPSFDEKELITLLGKQRNEF